MMSLLSAFNKKTPCTMTREELEFMRNSKVGELIRRSRHHILMQGSNSPQNSIPCFRAMGFAIVAGQWRTTSHHFVFPGDFLGLGPVCWAKWGIAFDARTHMRMCVFKSIPTSGLFSAVTPIAPFESRGCSNREHFLGERWGPPLSVQRTALQAVSWANAQVF